ncbi:MAG: hypothetical protein J6Y72_00765 [Bacteroidales bacterium]|nr:hypothetical protein [Bacteroidales bacterium]
MKALRSIVTAAVFIASLCAPAQNSEPEIIAAELWECSMGIESEYSKVWNLSKIGNFSWEKIPEYFKWLNNN